jgi:hypothetical protein
MIVCQLARPGLSTGSLYRIHSSSDRPHHLFLGFHSITGTDVPAPTPSNHARRGSRRWSFSTPFPPHLLSRPVPAGALLCFPVQVRRAALIGYRQYHLMILVPPQRSGLRLCVCVASSILRGLAEVPVIAVGWRFGQVGMAVASLAPSPRHSLQVPRVSHSRSPGSMR